jgi:hypothetical protein
MNGWSVPVALLAGAAGALLAWGCGAQDGGAGSPASRRNVDRTEVSVQVSEAGIASEEPKLVAPIATSRPAEGAASDGGDPGDDVSGGGKQEPTVEKAVAPARPRIRACYRKMIAADPSLGGQATFDATVGATGTVSSARFVKRDGLSEEMVGCILSAIKTMTFDAGRKSQILTFSFGSAPTRKAAEGDAGAPRTGDAGTKR